MQGKLGIDMTRWTNATNKSWDGAMVMMDNFDIRWLFEGEEDLLTPREERQHDAENRIKVLARIFKLCPLPNTINNNTWASDGSMTSGNSRNTGRQDCHCCDHRPHHHSNEDQGVQLKHSSQ